MSLLDCICCPEHEYRTAVVSDDLKISSVETYGCVIRRACLLACYLRRKFSGQNEEEATKPDMVVGILSESCPEALSAIVAVLAVPAVFMPLSPGGGEGETEERLRQRGVKMLLVHHSCLQEFLSAEWSESRMTIDTTTLQLGFLIFSRTPSSSPSSSPSSPLGHRCSHTERCRDCSSLDLAPPPTHAFLTDSMNSYKSDTHQLTRCIVCSIHRAKNGDNDDITKRAIYSHSDAKDSRTSVETGRRWNFPSLSPAGLAYIMHTSGTTGSPKPVHAPHCCVVPNILDLTHRFSLSPDDTVFNAAPLTFDPSVVEIFLALYSGACLLSVASRVRRSPQELADALFRRNPTTVLQITPSLFRRLPETDVADRLLGDRSSVRVLALGGEQFPSLCLLSHHKTASNGTLVFNIYGTTEVSSWSTCHALTEADVQRASDREGEGEGEGEGGEGEVPLGKPMLGTSVEVRDSEGRAISKGYGEIFLGGGYRVCYLGDEASPAHSVLRSTGDSGWVSGEGEVYFVGRQDRQIKRWGHRLSLDLVEKHILSQKSVGDCAVAAVSDSSTLHRIFPTAGADHHRLVAFAVPRPPTLSPSDWADELLTGLAHCLPGHMVPDVIAPVVFLPCNRNGKVDLQRLLRFDEDPSLYLSPLPLAASARCRSSAPSGGILAIERELQLLVTRLTKFSEWPHDSTLLDLGASSFDVVRIADAVEGKFGELSPLASLTDALLTGTFRGVADFLWAELSGEIERGGEIEGEPLPKRARRESSDRAPPKKVASGSIRAWRRGKEFFNGEPALAMVCGGLQLSEEVPLVEMRVKWTYDTGKCVDASPLVVRGDQAPPTVFIGSHSGVFVALCVTTGRCQWKIQLSDRIESSACLSANGAQVLVGCYDGYVYCLSVGSGRVQWSLQLSSEPVKSSPCVDVSSGLVWVGSHDQHLYAIDGERGRVVHRVFLGGGSCFSSPCVDPSRGLVYAATLQGLLAAVDKENGCVLWRYRGGGGKPFFSSPCLLPSGEVAIGSVDNCVHIVDSLGKIVRRLRTGNPVFSSPSVAQLREALPDDRQTLMEESVGEGGEEGGGQVRIFCGSHDQSVYCWSGREGELVWRASLDSEVYATPTPCNLLRNSKSHETLKTPPSPTEEDAGSTVPGVCVSTSSGVLHLLDVLTGRSLGSLRLPGQVFSSPVVMDNHVLVGCRDNSVYCVQCYVN